MRKLSKDKHVTLDAMQQTWNALKEKAQSGSFIMEKESATKAAARPIALGPRRWVMRASVTVLDGDDDWSVKSA